MMSKTALLEAVKELLRVIVLSVIPLVISGLESNYLDWKTIYVVAVIAGLRFIDKYLHELGKETDNQDLISGITRF